MNPLMYLMTAAILIAGIVATVHSFRYLKKVETGQIKEEDAMYIKWFGTRVPAIVLVCWVIGVGAILNVVLATILTFQKS